MTVKAILCLDTDICSSLDLAYKREDFLAYSITFLKEITFQYMPLYGGQNTFSM